MYFFTLYPDTILLVVLDGWLEDGCLPSVRAHQSPLVFAPAPLVQACQSLVVCFLRSIDYVTVLVVLSMLPLSCVVDDLLVLSTSSSACLELCETSKFSEDVHTPILKEYSLCHFVC